MSSSGWFRNGIVWLLILVAFAALFFSFLPGQDRREVKPITEVAALARDGHVSKVSVDGDDLYVTLDDNKIVTSRKERNESAWQALDNLGVNTDRLTQIKFEVRSPNQWGNVFAVLGSFLPILIFGGFLLLMMRQAQTGNNQAMSFGKSRARMFSGDKPTVTFTDVAGVDEAKEELQEIVEFLKEPQKFVTLGARIPKGVLMVGPPGCGKTLMARAVAGEAEVPFFSISGSEFVEMFVGVGASRVRDLFEQAKKHSPCIVFIDEIDAVGRHRGAGLGGSHDEREQTLNQILVEMDGFGTDTNVIVIAATNRPDILDPALLRPGRFDRRVILDRPDMRGRLSILKIHTRGKPLAEDVNLEVIARQTPGFSGADLENLVNESAILAARKNRRNISLSEMQDAIEKVVLGPERRSRVMSRKEQTIAAYHEAGHALVAHMLPNSDPVHKVSIVARGMAGGVTIFLPDEDRYLMSRKRFEDRLASMLGGRAAEEIQFTSITTGASDDLERVTKLARAMVTQYGMSDRLGPLTFGNKQELVFLGREIGEQRNYSEEVAQEIDREVKRIVTEAYDKAREILISHRDKLTSIAQRLLDKETIDRAEFLSLFEQTVVAA